MLSIENKINIRYIDDIGELAQLVEQLIYTEKVTGSSPVFPTNFNPVGDSTESGT